MRLTSDVWVSAYLTRLRLIDVPAFVVSKGDATAGAVLVKVSTLDGKACCYQRSFDLMENRRTWMVLCEGPDHEVEEVLSRQRRSDPDLWVIEVEDRAGRHLLDEPGLSE